MKKIMKKSIALLLTLSMVLSLTGVFAAASYVKFNLNDHGGSSNIYKTNADTTIVYKTGDDTSIIAAVYYNLGEDTTPVLLGDVLNKVFQGGKPTDDDYAFKGWFKNTGEEIKDTYEIAPDTTLYAQWAELFTVTFNWNRNGNDSEVYETYYEVEEDTKVTEPTKPTRDGYTFGGWFQEAGCDNEWLFNIYTVTRDTNLYAKWTEDDNGSTGGGGGSASNPVEVPAVGETSNAVKVEATVSGSTATVKEISASEISKVGTDVVSMDFSGLNKTVKEVKLPTKSVKAIADSDASGLEIKLSTGAVVFDADAVKAISKAAAGNDIALKIEAVDKKSLTPAQKSTVEGLGNAVIIRATLISGGKTISDFGGGSATVTVPYEKKDANAVVAVYYLDASGKLTKMKATYDEATKSITFVTPHFSEYVLTEVEALPFVDVFESDYYADAVRWAAANGITIGTDATHFSPKASVTRAQVVTFLWRAAGSPEPTGDASKFADVPANEYYAKAIAWAIEQGITKGTSETTFSPDAVCTRGQIVTFLARYAGVEDAATESVFDDVKTTDYFAAAVKWAADNGVTTGTSATTFSPADDCPRGQVVTFLYRWMVK